MNRPIKFRAWDEEKYRWCERGEILLTLDGDWRSNFGDHGRLVFSQWTGLLDKNGKEIYEGDVLSSDEYPFVGDGGLNYVAEVVFEDGGFHAVLSMTKEGRERVNGVAEGNSVSGAGMSELEIIGNIYENPELLKV